MENRLGTTFLLLMALEFCAIVPTSAATISTDTVLGPGHPFPEQTITVIDGANPPTTVTVTEGALVGDIIGGENIQVGFDVFGQSRISMLGGTLRGTQQAALLHDQSIFHMVDGLVRIGAIEARDSSRVIVDGGEWQDVQAFDSSRVEVNGGVFGSINSLQTFNDAHAVVNGSGLDALADDTSSIVVNFGRFESFQSLGNSEVLIKGGGYTTGIRAMEESVLHIRGIDGIPRDEPVWIEDSAVVHVYGTGLHFDVIPDPDIQIDVVRGTWADGSEALFRYRLFDQGQIILHEVPEPASWAVLAVGALALGVMRWRGGRRADS